MKISEAQRARFIIAADDYGIRSTAAPILELAQKGLLDRVAVMVHYVTPEDARALKDTGVKLDIHLELIELLERGETPNDSTLERGFSFLSRYLLGSIRAYQVKGEWRTQIERFREIFGQLPDGLNSHEHVHYFPPFFRPFVELANEYQIPYVRFGHAGFLLHVQQSMIGYILAFLRFFDKPRFYSAVAETSDYLVDLNWLKSFGHLMEAMPRSGRIELVVHPERQAEWKFVQETFSL